MTVGRTGMFQTGVALGKALYLSRKLITDGCSWMRSSINAQVNQNKLKKKQG